MSRTHKDKPRRVRLRENVNRGLIAHDHREDLSHTIRKRLDPNLSLTYYKWAQREINAYRKYLNTLENIAYDEIECGNAYVFETLDNNDHETGHWDSKTIRFDVYRIYRRDGRDGHCTIDEYDENVSPWKQGCTPKITHDMERRRKNRSRYSRAQVRTVTNNALRYTNGGNLDDYYSNPVLEEQYGPKFWSWDD